MGHGSSSGGGKDRGSALRGMCGPRSSPGSRSGGSSTRRGLRGPQSTIPARRPWSPECRGTQPRIQHSPWDRRRLGGHRTVGRSCHRAPQSCADQRSSPLEHPGPCRLGAVVFTAGADSRAGDLAATSLVVLPCITLCLGWSRATRGLTG